MKKWLMMLLLAVLPALALAGAETPEMIVKNVSRDVLEAIKKNDKDVIKLREQVSQKVEPLADYTRMTALAVGRYWKSATPEQQQQLTGEFRQMLVRTYLSALTIYKNAQVNVIGARPGESVDEQSVRTEVSIPGQKVIPLEFYFERLNGSWKVYDIAVDGISFTVNNRNQFGSAIRQKGIDGLIKQLSDLNAQANVSGKAANK
ncbi:phospholipid transport system substrate-binding protein [Andreprevotia lacus DSM 23236]|jgi:phospholipid transport system substrate-binding protein|uniref:Phospholipid transport system substrate-binding protein n=1 Tax=Andreprevotia lacus DSM 23236 TaxID=1121001 RepID=A0A1W1XTC5_9NEIS|nr:ABC transporter substrate-binding protein [Andreprevotia lacus]SMC27102.1 phospholipid transport system substrate-binding protein [Andreprevotia lacus DSM 23236]